MSRLLKIGVLGAVMVLCPAGSGVARFVAATQSQQAMPATFTEPYLLTLHPSTEMNVCWIASESVLEAYVEYGSTPQLGSRVNAVQHRLLGLKKSPAGGGDYNADPQANPELPAYQQIAKLGRLRSDTTYYYRAVTRTAGHGLRTGGTYRFKTAPGRGKSARFALLSDLQQKPRTMETVKLVGRAHPDFIIYNGDLVNTPWKAGEWFPVPGVYSAPGERGKEWFTAMQQTGDECRLLQYAPIFPCPGNHELTDQRVLTDKKMALDKSLWNLGIYMQLFRPLYPDQQYGAGGKHWYSADYGDMHIASLSVLRWHPWAGTEWPGWHPFDDVRPGSAQYRWLARDLGAAGTKYKWVTMHWHMLNRGSDGWVPYSFPAPAGDGSAVEYPEPDYCHTYLKPLFERTGVNAVSYGHSHVYERYVVNGVNYIEAASIGNNYRNPEDPYPIGGHKPVREENGFRSFMLVGFDPDDGLTATGVQASVGPDGTGQVGRVFDAFRLAPGARPSKEVR